MARLSIRTIVACSAISIALASSCVYAASDAGSSLRDWYETRSKQVTEQLSDSVHEQGLAQAAASSASYAAELAEEAEEALSQQAESSLDETTQRIQAAGSQYVNQVEEAAQSAASALQLEFDAYVSSASRASEMELEQLAIDTIEELTEQLITEDPSNH